MQEPPNPYPQFQSSSYTSKLPHHYKGWMLTALVITYLISLVFLITEVIAVSSVPTHAESSNSPFGILTTLTTILMFVLYCFIFVLDGRNVLTLFERLHWKQLSTWKRVGLVFVYLCVFIIPALYLFFATQYFLRVRHQTLSGAIHNEWRRYRGKSPAERIGIALIISFLLLSFVGLTRVFANIDRENMLTSTQLTPTVAPILAPQATTTPTQSVAFQSPTDTPTAESTSSETPVPTDTPTPIPTLQSTQSLAATHGTPQLGGPISDFIGAFGPPNDHSKPAASLGQYHFQRDANTTDVADGLIVLTSIDIENVVDNIEVQAVAQNATYNDPQAGSSFSPSDAKARCMTFAPSDARFVKEFVYADNAGFDMVYISSSLAQIFPASDFTDSQQNQVQAGMFDVSYLYNSNGDTQHISSCEMIIGEQQTTD